MITPAATLQFLEVAMQVQFWGTRGSIPKPGPTTIRYGGNTLCLEIRTARGTLVIIDCGTGLHGLGIKLSSGGRGLAGHILISHTHWDHIQGVPFFAPFFVPGNRWEIYGPKGLHQSLRDTLAGQMQHTYFPITPDQFGASIRYHDLLEGKFEIDDIKVTTQYLNHTALTLGYRLESDGATVVYCCDHEPFSREVAEGYREISGLDQQHADFIEGADLLVHDAQYTAAEYPSKVGWGHSSAEFVVKLARHANVKHVVLAHHDPLRTDEAVDGIIAKLRDGLRADHSTVLVSAATEGETIEVEASSGAPSSRTSREEFNAMMTVKPALSHRSVLIRVADVKVATALGEAVQAEGLRANFCSSADTARKLIAEDPPSLALIDEPLADENEGGVLSVLRAIKGGELPVVMVAARQHERSGITDWLTTPFLDSYARTKIRAWVLREACRWIRAPIPEGEPARLNSLRALNLLDTEPEERFDRITRLATALFNVPMATITLVDESRQWFKSCQGTIGREDPRDASFCAHVVYNREPIIVVDTHSDERFADNPLVLGGPRIRFYAGYPLVLDDGSCIGTLCLLDTRPHTFEQPNLKQLRDLALMVMEQFQTSMVERDRDKSRP